MVVLMPSLSRCACSAHTLQHSINMFAKLFRDKTSTPIQLSEQIHRVLEFVLVIFALLGAEQTGDGEDCCCGEQELRVEVVECCEVATDPIVRDNLI